MFIDSRLVSRLAPFEGAEELLSEKIQWPSAPSNGAEGQMAARPINISPLAG